MGASGGGGVGVGRFGEQTRTKEQSCFVGSAGASEAVAGTDVWRMGVEVDPARLVALGRLAAGPQERAQVLPSRSSLRIAPRRLRRQTVSTPAEGDP